MKNVLKSLFVRNIKKGFATNSSSYHSTIVMTEEDHEKWKEGDVVVDGYTHEDWYNDEYAEYDTTYFTTPQGDKIVILCQYGYDY